MKLFCSRCATIPEQEEATIIYNGKSLCYDHFQMEIKRES
jgi:hypothetical protein